MACPIPKGGHNQSYFMWNLCNCLQSLFNLVMWFCIFSMDSLTVLLAIMCCQWQQQVAYWLCSQQVPSDQLDICLPTAS